MLGATPLTPAAFSNGPRLTRPPEMEAPTVIAVWDAGLAVSIDFSLMAAGFEAIIEAPVRDFKDLPLDVWSPLIVVDELPSYHRSRQISGLRWRGWRGMGIVLTQGALDPAAWSDPLRRFACLDMPFGAGAIIDLVRRAHTYRPLANTA